MGLPMPKLWLIPNGSPNAFDTGPNLSHALVAPTYGHRRDENGSGGYRLFMPIVAPIAAMLIQRAISRAREFSAGGAAAKYTRTPGGLNSAPGKLEGWSKRIPMDASPATAPMFIIKPFTGNAIFTLFSTHPSTQDRIARLQAAR